MLPVIGMGMRETQSRKTNRDQCSPGRDLSVGQSRAGGVSRLFLTAATAQITTNRMYTDLRNR
jgi:hypothetical protein